MFVIRPFLPLLVLLVLCAGCTPLVKRPGSAIAPPVLTATQFITADGAVLPVRAWLPATEQPKAIIVALHGFNDYSNFFTKPAEYLSQQGIACYAYDQRGFGKSPGRGFWAGVEAYADDLQAFAAQVRQRHPGIPLYVLGESMGGAVGLVATTTSPTAFADGLILASPAVWSRATMPWYQRALLGTLAYTVPWLRLTGEGLKIMASDNIDMLRALGRDPLVIKATRVDAMYGLADLMDAALVDARQVPVVTLVLYGGRDQVIPRAPVEKMLATMPRTRTRAVFYENGYHMLLRDLHAETFWRDIAVWVINHDAPLPSQIAQQVGKGVH